jgi:hypothetical protein
MRIEKYRKVKELLCCLFGICGYIVCETANALPTKTIITCKISDDGAKASLIAETTIDGNRLYLQFGDQKEKAFTDLPNTDFVGRIAMVRCVKGVLVFALDYGSPYIKGAAIRLRHNSSTLGQRERIDFAEKAKPGWLYVGREQIKIVIRNIGVGATSKYLVYSSALDSNASDVVVETNTLPNKTAGYRAVRL